MCRGIAATKPTRTRTEFVRNATRSASLRSGFADTAALGKITTCWSALPAYESAQLPLPLICNARHQAHTLLSLTRLHLLHDKFWNLKQYYNPRDDFSCESRFSAVGCIAVHAIRMGAGGSCALAYCKKPRARCEATPEMEIFRIFGYNCESRRKLFSSSHTYTFIGGPYNEMEGINVTANEHLLHQFLCSFHTPATTSHVVL